MEQYISIPASDSFMGRLPLSDGKHLRLLIWEKSFVMIWAYSPEQMAATFRKYH
ncbi:MAG: hypothetical protein GX587_04580 [Bacteroidales bacterium]|nr:hypothetical protein [Bacteroidales bacterium]